MHGLSPCGPVPVIHWSWGLTVVLKPTTLESRALAAALGGSLGNDLSQTVAQAQHSISEIFGTKLCQVTSPVADSFLTCCSTRSSTHSSGTCSISHLLPLTNSIPPSREVSHQSAPTAALVSVLCPICISNHIQQAAHLFCSSFFSTRSSNSSSIPAAHGHRD